MISVSLDEGAMLPREGGKVFTSWLKAYRKGAKFIKGLLMELQKAAAFFSKLRH